MRPTSAVSLLAKISSGGSTITPSMLRLRSLSWYTRSRTRLTTTPSWSVVNANRLKPGASCRADGDVLVPEKVGTSVRVAQIDSQRSHARSLGLGQSELILPAFDGPGPMSAKPVAILAERLAVLPSLDR